MFDVEIERETIYYNSNHVCVSNAVYEIPCLIDLAFVNEILRSIYVKEKPVSGQKAYLRQNFKANNTRPKFLLHPKKQKPISVTKYLPPSPFCFYSN